MIGVFSIDQFFLTFVRDLAAKNEIFALLVLKADFLYIYIRVYMLIERETFFTFD